MGTLIPHALTLISLATFLAMSRYLLPRFLPLLSFHGKNPVNSNGFLAQNGLTGIGQNRFPRSRAYSTTSGHSC